MTQLPVQTVRRLYDEQTLAIFKEVLDGVAFDPSSDPIASQIIDPERWRSMEKGALMVSKTVEPELNWALARAIAYDRYLPTVVLARAQSMLRMTEARGPVEVVYFPDAIGILNHDSLWRWGRTAEDPIEAYVCLVTRDVTCLSDLGRRQETFERTAENWLAHIDEARARCNRLTLPPIESLLRAAHPSEPHGRSRG